MKSKLFLLAAAFAAVVTISAAADQVVEEIVARVNDAIITRADLQREKEALQQTEQQEGADSARVSEDQKNLLRDLIDQRLLIDKANEAGVDVNNDVLKQLDKMRQDMHLASMDDLQKEAEKQGIDFADYKQTLKEKLMTQVVIEHEVGSKASTGTPEEIKQFYDSHQKELTREEQVCMSEILISPNPEALAVQQAADQEKKQAEKAAAPPEPTQEQLDAAKNKADQAEAELKKGVKFDELAKKLSNGPTSQGGGDLGCFKRGVLDKGLEDRTFAMKVGDYTEPVLTKQGYDILKITQHVKGGVPPLKEVEPQIREAIYSKNIQPLLRQYLTKLREEAYIDIKPGYLDAGASPNQTRPVIAMGPTEKGGSGKDKPGKKKKFGIF